VLLIWTGFIALILAMLALDLGVFHRKAHVVKLREALTWSGVWVVISLLFSLFIYFAYDSHWRGIGSIPDPVGGEINNGREAVIKYLTGYVVEKSLSVDNIFVIAMLFGFFAVPQALQHRVLFWGIIGALVMRGIMIGVGSEIIARYHWTLYIFGSFLILTAVKMLLVKSHDDPSKNVLLRFLKKWFRITDHYVDGHFLVRLPEGFSLTPLAVALVMVEGTDLIFAVDSIPAIFAITGDPFLVFTSNVFAILGLRSLYFALAGMITMFRYLKPALAVVLAVVGVKMLLASQLKTWLGENVNFYLLAVVLLILAAGVVASLLHRNDAAAEAKHG